MPIARIDRGAGGVEARVSELLQNRRRVTVAILIRRVGDLYEAEVIPPQGDVGPCRSPKAMTSDALIDALLSLGCHQTAIGDAFYEADPGWLSGDGTDRR